MSGPVGFPLATYRYVRLSLIAVVAGLLASVVLTAVPQSCWQTSISAFYFTYSHTVFIGALCAAGVCLIAYKGMSRPEDILLNFSGFLAFVVALLPTVSPRHNPHDSPAGYCGLWLPTDDDAAAAAGNNIAALLIGTVAGVIAFLVVRAIAPPPPTADSETHTDTRDLPRRRGLLLRVADFVLKWSQVLVPALVVAATIAGVGWFLIARESLIDNGHGAAAIAMFAGIIAVVVLHACYSAQHFCHCSNRGRFAVAYITIAATMSATLVVVAVLHQYQPTWNHWILALESALILQFAAFWTLQTTDSWNGVYQPAMPKVTLHPDHSMTDIRG